MYCNFTQNIHNNRNESNESKYETMPTHCWSFCTLLQISEILELTFDQEGEERLSGEQRIDPRVENLKPV